MSKDKIQFLEYQKPALESGEYSAIMKQNVKTGKSQETFISNKLNFTVKGERFTLDPSAIHAKFPPQNSLGLHSDVLPHISLKRSTYPWERSAYGADDFESWLALLLFDESEHIEKKQITYTELKNDKSVEFPVIISKNNITGEKSFPFLIEEEGEKEKITVIDIEPTLISKVIPTGKDLKILAHVRKRIKIDSESELSVVICNRLPKPGSISTMHLVSLEGRYDRDGVFYLGKSNKKVRLVSLASWSYACLPNQGNTFEELIQNIKTDLVRIPVECNSCAAPYLNRGWVLLPQKYRYGDRGYSWYHSPLATQEYKKKFLMEENLPDFPDSLLEYHQDMGLMDSSYATAYELGRTLAIEDEIFSGDLYHLKECINRRICFELQKEQASLLTPAIDDEEDLSVLEDKISSWLYDIALLKGIPFNYLIPAPLMLTPESLRFFQVDQHWLECMLYGAYSIGGPIRKKNETDKVRLAWFNKLIKKITEKKLSGFILRSELVRDYPDLIEDAFNSNKLDTLREDFLEEDVMIKIYKGEISTLELYLKPEGLHFGLDEENGKLKKELRTNYLYNFVKNHLSEPPVKKLSEIKKLITKDNSPFDFTEKGCDKPQSDGSKFEFPVHFLYKEIRILDIQDILKNISKIIKTMASLMSENNEVPTSLQQISSAQFGMTMIEGSNKGRFLRKKQ